MKENSLSIRYAFDPCDYRNEKAALCAEDGNADSTLHLELSGVKCYKLSCAKLKSSRIQLPPCVSSVDLCLLHDLCVSLSVSSKMINPESRDLTPFSGRELGKNQVDEQAQLHLAFG